MTNHPVSNAVRARWAAAGAAATLAGLAGLALAWGRAAAENERYGTHQRQGERRPSGGLRSTPAPTGGGRVAD